VNNKKKGTRFYAAEYDQAVNCVSMALSIQSVVQGEIGRLIVERSLLSGSENQHPILAIYLTIGQYCTQ
jgi:hypothetical protein